MSVTHHPAGELLIAYAGGAADEGTSLVIATHLALCPACRRIVASAEAAGGVLLSDMNPVALGNSALSNVLSRLDGQEKSFEPAPVKSAIFPEPLRSYLGGDLQNVKWVSVTKGISVKPVFRRGSTRVQLIRSLPGAGVGIHSHRGEELTLVLEGGFTDVTGHYLRGDLQTADGSLTHRPMADEGGPCVSLAVTGAPLKFASSLVGLLAKFYGF
jgi:putative transcriptional regulator